MNLNKPVQRVNEPGNEFRRKLYNNYGYLIEKYDGHVIEEDTNESGSTITVDFNSALLHVMLSRRDWGAEIKILCPSIYNSSHGWEDPFMIIECICDLSEIPRPMRGTLTAPEAIDQVLTFLKEEDYSQLCTKYKEWREHRVKVAKEIWRKRQQAKTNLDSKNMS